MSSKLVADDSLPRSRRPHGDAHAATALAVISNAMVRLHKEAFGRGPTKSRTAFAGADTLVVVLEDGLTVAERTLLALGSVEELRRPRLVVQRALEGSARAVVEGALARRTLAFMTEVDPVYGVAVNVFTLEPVGIANGHQNGAAVNPRKLR